MSQNSKRPSQCLQNQVEFLKLIVFPQRKVQNSITKHKGNQQIPTIEKLEQGMFGIFA